MATSLLEALAVLPAARLERTKDPRWDETLVDGRVFDASALGFILSDLGFYGSTVCLPVAFTVAANLPEMEKHFFNSPTRYEFVVPGCFFLLGYSVLRARNQSIGGVPWT